MDPPKQIKQTHKQKQTETFWKKHKHTKTKTNKHTNTNKQASKTSRKERKMKPIVNAKIKLMIIMCTIVFRCLLWGYSDNYSPKEPNQENKTILQAKTNP